MKTYSAIKAEIAKLERQAEAVRKSEVAGVIAKIKEAIAAYGLTAADLGFGRSAAKATRSSKASKKTGTTVGVAKYRDPKTGKTWTGRGKPPAWIAGVKNRDPYLIDGQVTDAAGATPPKRPANRAQQAAGTTPAKAKKAGAKRAARLRQKASPTPLKTAAVEIESGSASQ